MARRPGLFVRGLSDGEAAHLLEFVRSTRNPVRQHGAKQLLASFRRQHPDRFRATYRRTAGVRHLVAARDPAIGPMYGDIRSTETRREVPELLRSLRARFTEHVVVVLDNFSPHHKRDLRDWAAEHDIGLVYLPTYASRLNLMECQFQALRRFASYGIDFASHAEQGAATPAGLRWPDRKAWAAKPWHIKAEVHHSLLRIAA